MVQSSLRDIATTATWRGAAVFAAALCCWAFAVTAPRPASAAAPAICPAGQQASSKFVSDFENPAETLSAWRASPLGGTPALPGGTGQLGQSHWYYPPPEPGSRPWSGSLNIWADVFAGGARSGPAESAFEMQSGIQLPPGAHLSFVHRFDFTAVPDSWGFVEHSLDGGLTWRGLGGFRGSVEQHHSSHFDLSAAAGSVMRLRFRVAVAASTAETPSAGSAFRGWAIDDVHIYTCAEPAAGDREGADEVARQLGTLPIGMVVARNQRVLRGRTQLKLRLANASRSAVRKARVCFRAPRRLISGNRCVLIRLLPAGSTAELAFPIKVLAGSAVKRRPRVVIGYVVRQGGTALATARRAYRLAPERSLLRRAGSRR